MTLSGCGTAAAPSFSSPSKNIWAWRPSCACSIQNCRVRSQSTRPLMALELYNPQAGQPIEFASRSLTDTQCRYAQMEKDLLAVQFGVTLSSLRLRKSGNSKNLSQAPGWIRRQANWILFPRIHRMRLLLKVYCYQLLYKHRKELRNMGRISRR